MWVMTRTEVHGYRLAPLRGESPQAVQDAAHSSAVQRLKTAPHHKFRLPAERPESAAPPHAPLERGATPKG